MKKKITIEKLEALLNDEEATPIEILPNGKIRKVRKSKREPKILTMKENLGGEYGVAA